MDLNLPSTYTPAVPPYAHQREALERGWYQPGYGYLMEMGLGKSRVAIDNFCLLYKQGRCGAVLVVAPKGVYTNWSRVSDTNPGELQRWLWPEIAATAQIFVWATGRTKSLPYPMLSNSPAGLRIVLVNAEALAVSDTAVKLSAGFLRAFPNAMIVVDESTLIKNPKSRRTKEVLALGKRARWRRILSGLPTTGSPSDLWSQFEFLETSALGYRTYNAFRAAYCKFQEIVANGRTVRIEVGVRNTDELARRVAEHSYRARKADCLDLPAKVYLTREVELTVEQKRLYKELKATAMLEMTVHGGLTTQNVVTQILRLHQLVCGHLRYDSGEVQSLEENRTRVLLEVLEEADEPAIIWATYQEDVRRIGRVLRERYGPGSVSEWHGAVSQREREAGEARWLEGESRYMLATPQAGGRGRTWVRAGLTVYYSNTYDLELRQQSEDRTHRIGQRGTCTYVDLVAPGTVDERIISALQQKEDVVRAILQDGPRAFGAKI